MRRPAAGRRADPCSAAPATAPRRAPGSRRAAGRCRAARVPSGETYRFHYVENRMETWTRTMIRLRWAVLAAWLVAIVLGVVAFGRLAPLLSNTFSVPGSESEQAREVLAEQFGQRDDGSYIVVFRVADARDAAVRARLQAALARAAQVVPTGRARPLQAARGDVRFGNVDSSLRIDEAKGYT